VQGVQGTQGAVRYPILSNSESVSQSVTFAGEYKRLIRFPLGLRRLERQGHFLCLHLWFHEHKLTHVWWIAAHRW
jgi:hypothetical protein